MRWVVVGALDQRRRRFVLGEPVGLVVDDQDGAVALPREHVDEAADERPAAAGLELEREAGLAADAAGPRQARAQR